jgi:hypothetical protein
MRIVPSNPADSVTYQQDVQRFNAMFGIQQ